MNAFSQHHKDNITFPYRCLDRMLFNAATQKDLRSADSWSAEPPSRDANLPDDRISTLDKLYLAVSTALDDLVEAAGFEAA